MPSPLRNVLARCGNAALLAVLPGLVGLAFTGLAAGCSKEGTTPTCTDNVTKDGILSEVDNPCQAFGQCVIDGDVHPAADCCVDENGDPLGDYDLNLCLYGFGAVDLDSTGGSGGSGGATTATGSGGSGGSGGG